MCAHCDVGAMQKHACARAVSRSKSEVGLGKSMCQCTVLAPHPPRDYQETLSLHSSTAYQDILMNSIVVNGKMKVMNVSL
jgi:hypothetical protein